MKRILYILLPAVALSLGSCSKIDYIQKLDSYNDNIFYVEDLYSGTSFISNEGSIKIEGDLVSQSYIVKINDLQLAEGLPLQSVTVSNLTQYWQPKGTNTDEEKNTALYYFFREENTTRTDGTFDISSMRYCFLTSTYWLNFNAENDRYAVWSTPRVRNLYANYNRTLSPSVSAGYHVEDALQPAYKFTVDTENKTITVRASGVKLKQDDQAEHTLDFRTMEWRNIPVEFSPAGYTFTVDELIPVIEGSLAPQYKITDLQGQIAYDYEGRKSVSYKILNGNGQNVFVVSEFDLYRK